MKRAVGVVVVLVCMLVGCTEKEPIDISNIGRVEVEQQGEKLTIWSHYGGWEEVIEDFNRQYPNMEVEVKVLPYEEYVSNYIDALVTGEVPDLMIIDSTDWANFNTLSSFENLSIEPYNASAYKKDFDPELWQLGKAFGGEELIGLSFATAPVVTYYRADVMEAYGFPSEPEALGIYMADPEKWLEMCRVFAKDNKYLSQWAGNAVWIAGLAGPCFDENLNFVRITSEFEQALGISQEVHKERLALYADIWMERGRQALRDGDLIMLYLGTWGANELQTLVPEQEGLWRVTRLPFNIYGWNNSTLMSIPKEGKNKEGAWNFIRFYNFEQDSAALGNIPGYLPSRETQESLNHENTFLGGQKDQQLYYEVLSKTQEYRITPLDKKGFEIWENILNLSLDEEYTVDETTKMMQNAIEERLGKEIELLRKELDMITE
ncbi:extracellular solute-binding protein [Niameybacter massiliensis]|uniref:Extracellular solute-binding protein n=1 Tax=Holtiella tumoricola TaxID=3018743 RepID=A0AA42DL21_9FIRM|nr:MULTISPECIES: extracellular solute-binding protein [Lachnospirales]MDA3730795.1 extracellular solute-binding protein [Holtiella tumoricola]